MQTKCIVFTLGIIFSCIYGVAPTKHLKLPSYIAACSKSDPNFDACCMQHATDALASILKGDKEYGIPPLNPLVIPSVELKTSGFRIAFKQLAVHNLERIVFTALKIDLDKKKISVKAELDQLSLVGQYECDGKILVMPIVGNGDFNITIDGLKIEYSVKFKIEEIEGDEYIILSDDVSIDYTLKRAYFYLAELFGGNKEMGDATLMTLNKEWDQVVGILKPVISETILNIIHMVVQGFLSNIPFKDIFLE